MTDAPGLLLPAVVAVVGRLKTLSVGRLLVQRFAGKGPAPGKLPAWAGDLYQLGVLAVSIALLLAAPTLLSRPGLRTAALVFLGYRAFELMVFLLAWVFVDAEPLHSYRRSVLGFGINLLEVAVGTAAAATLWMCHAGQSAYATAWMQLSALMSLDGSDLATAAGACRAIGVARFSLGAMLLLLCFAALAGGLMREELPVLPPTKKDDRGSS